MEGEIQRGRKESKEQERRKVVWDSEEKERFKEELRIKREERKEINEEWREMK